MLGWIKRLFGSKKSEEKINESEEKINELIDHDATTCDLGLQELNDNDIIILLKYIKSNKTMDYLDLYCNYISDKGE